LLRCMSLVMAQNGRADAVAGCPLLRDERTCWTAHWRAGIGQMPW